MMELQERFNEKYVVDSNSGCWIWTASCDLTGYGSFWNGAKLQPAHRASYELTLRSIPEGMCVCHKCDVRSCVNPDHLFLGTKQDNTDDMIKKGRNTKGEQCVSSKLTRFDVSKIRELLTEGMRHNKIGKMFNVSRQAVTNINTGRSWGHLKIERIVK